MTPFQELLANCHYHNVSSAPEFYVRLAHCLWFLILIYGDIYSIMKYWNSGSSYAIKLTIICGVNSILQSTIKFSLICDIVFLKKK